LSPRDSGFFRPRLHSHSANTLHVRWASSSNSSNSSSSSISSILTEAHATPSIDNKGSYLLPHPIWKGEYVDAVKATHRKPETTIETLAYYVVRLMRFNFDWMSGYSWKAHTPDIYTTRLIFLETVAGVPGSIAAIARHLASLRRTRRDHGWIHTLLEEAENERMHLLTFIQLRTPGPFFRLCIFLTQGVFFNFFLASYLISPRFCHRLVGYLEEEAVITYSKCIHEVDTNPQMSAWKTMAAPEIARSYWKLPASATFRDVLLHVRADEAHHRNVNHDFATIGPNAPNPHKI